MEIYYDLINKIASLSEEEVEKLEESYNNLFNQDKSDRKRT